MKAFRRGFTILEGMSVTGTAIRAYNVVDTVFLVMTISLASKTPSWFWDMEFYIEHKTANLYLFGEMTSIEGDAERERKFIDRLYKKCIPS